MRLSLTAGGKCVSADCFRLVGLAIEEQNDAEVVKPVLNEIEVLRLCSELNMLPTVNRKDFESGLISPEEFDEEFAHYLRRTLCRKGCAEDADVVTTIGLFGKQQEVKRALTRFGLWSPELDKGLKARDQGIYCAKAPDESGSLQKSTLVLFAWIQDCLFDPAHLRDTATYVLRFLACMSSDLQCCLSPQDVADVERAVRSLSTNSSSLSYSVGFRVEKQEDAKDGVACVGVGSIEMPSFETARDIRVLKGKFPGVSAVVRAPRHRFKTKEWVSHSSVQQFADWMVGQAKEYAVTLNASHYVDPELLHALLKASGKWPTEQLDEVNNELSRSLGGIEEQSREEVKKQVDEWRGAMLEIVDKLFNVEYLLGLGDDGDNPYRAFRARLEKLQRDQAIWRLTPSEVQVILDLPLRMKNQIKNLFSVFLEEHSGDQDPERLDSILKRLPVDAKPVMGGKGFLQSARDFIRGKPSTDADAPAAAEAFKLRLMDPLVSMRERWWHAIDTVLEGAPGLMLKKAVDVRKLAFEKTAREDRDQAIVTAFDDLVRYWRRSADGGLLLSVTATKQRSYYGRDSVQCNVIKECWKPERDELCVSKIVCDGKGQPRIETLGVVPLNSERAIVQSFTVGCNGLLVVLSAPKETKVLRVNFHRQQDPWAMSNQASAAQHVVGEFRRQCTVCDFNVKERLMAFITDHNCLFVYRFNASFESMEVTKRIELSVHTSLSTVVEVAVAEQSVYLVDNSGAYQSVNFRSLQTSRKVSPPESDSSLRRGGLLLLSDGLAIGRFVVAPKPGEGMCGILFSSEYRGSLEVAAGEDFRSIPTVFPDAILLCQDSVSECVDDKLFVVDAIACLVSVFSVSLTVRSDSFRIRHSNQKSMAASKESKKNPSEHWLRALYHMYEKFPIGGLLQTINDNSTEMRLRVNTRRSLPDESARACRDFLECVMIDLRKLSKSLRSVDVTRDVRFVNDEMDDIEDGWNALTSGPLNAFIQNLITFVPVQICRAEGNALTVMANGLAGTEAPISESQGVQAVDIMRSIRFGLLSPLLNAWNGPVVVITSMGKQSTGKSYMLNHLTGSSFAIAGARCTDGAWMSIRLLPMGVMLVVLDFEGLGSFERSEQEDVLLSVLNASISMFTILRMEMRFDKEMDELFARFQKGVALMKDDKRLFRGQLYMSVKDVNPNDQKGVMDEFVDKLEKLVGSNKEHNFLTDLYTGRLEINCSPPLGTLDYYKSLGHARNCIEDGLCGGNCGIGFPSGKELLDCIRLVLAKISILDWTSMDESVQQFVLSEVLDKLPGLVRTGTLIPRDQVGNTSLSLAEVSESITGINDSLEAMYKAYPTMAEKWVKLATSMKLDQVKDGDVDLGFNVCAMTDDSVADTNRALANLANTFVALHGLSDGYGLSHAKRADQSRFDDFLAFVVRRRSLRISEWAKTKFDGRVPDEWKMLEQQHLGRFTALFTRCQSKCKSCRLGCMKSAMHTGQLDAVHDCGTNHRCQRRCEYCLLAETSGKTPPCAIEAGHDGPCECCDGDHTCGQACYLAASPNCGQKCTAMRGHDGRHHCGASAHTCGKPCTLEKCSGRCILSVETSHTAHKCVEIACIEPCIMDGCSERCSELDHFHGHSEVAVAYSVENQVDGKAQNVFDAESATPVIHMCDKEHACPVTCAEDGICRVDVFLKQSSKEFAGARGKFRYTYQEMNGSRKKCGHVLDPKQQTHSGKHSCLALETKTDGYAQNGGGDTENTVHYCDVRCPCCSYYCNKEHGHTGLHATSHGNMRNTYFLSDTADIDINDRQYRAGETGEAEMCNLYCSKMGRAHVHYLDCEQNSKAKCVYSGSTNDQRRHCDRSLEPTPDHEMDEVLHEQFWRTLGWMDPCPLSVERELFKKCAYKCDAPDHSSKPSYCVLPAWHAPVSNPNNSNGSDVFSYASGHQFECTHVSSGGKNHHVFVLDCSGSMHGQPWLDLTAAVREYIHNCVGSGAALDIVSIVTFDSSAVLVYEAQNVTLMTNASVPYRGGGTTYATGLRLANEVLSRTNFSAYKPVVVFFSDGQPSDAHQGELLATHLKGAYEKYGLKAYAVGFGHINLGVLQRVADRMGGTYHNVLTGTEMKTTFYSISASLSTRAGLALTKKATHDTDCPICCKDLASGEARKLPRCSHVLHKACIAKLVARAVNNGEAALCPNCRRKAN